MSITDPSADDVQPDAGQGDGGQGGDPPYADYLSRIPEEYRGDVEPAFKAWDADVTRRFQDHAEFRKQWEPLAETGVNQMSPEQVAYAVQLFQAMDDPQVMKQWWDGYAQQNGLTQPDPQPTPQPETPGLDDFGYQDPNQQFQKLLEEQLGPLKDQLQQYGSRFEQQDQAQREADAARYIDGQFAELQTKHGEIDKETRELIETFAGKYIESDPMNAIPRAYDDLQALSNQIEKRTLQGKVDAPAPAETGGVPDVSPERHTRLDDPALKAAALETLRNMNRA